MKNIKPENLLIGLFLAASLALFAWFNMTKPRILVLHSYDKTYAWTRDVTTGLNRVLDSKHEYQLRWYYMDTKRHPWPEYRTTAGIAARNAIEKMQPDVVIAVDDDAQQYVMRHFINDPHIKIVFAGVNTEAGDYGFDHAANVTGILERLPLGAIREALLITDHFKALGRSPRLLYLGDKSESVGGDARQVQAFDWAPVQLTRVSRAGTWPEWQAQVEAAGQEADVILLTGYRRLARSATDKSLVPAHEVVEWTERHAHVPVISGNGFYTEEGGMLSIGTSPYEQGEVAAAIALQIALEGKKPDSIPIIAGNQFIVAMSGSKMKARGFTLPRVYEAAARTGDKYLP